VRAATGSSAEWTIGLADVDGAADDAGVELVGSIGDDLDCALAASSNSLMRASARMARAASARSASWFCGRNHQARVSCKLRGGREDCARETHLDLGRLAFVLEHGELPPRNLELLGRAVDVHLGLAQAGLDAAGRVAERHTAAHGRTAAARALPGRGRRGAVRLVGAAARARRLAAAAGARPDRVREALASVGRAGAAAAARAALAVAAKRGDGRHARLEPRARERRRRAGRARQLRLLEVGLGRRGVRVRVGRAAVGRRRREVGPGRARRAGVRVHGGGDGGGVGRLGGRGEGARRRRDTLRQAVRAELLRVVLGRERR